MDNEESGPLNALLSEDEASNPPAEAVPAQDDDAAFENEEDLLGGGDEEAEDEPEGEDLMGDDMEKDYRPMPHLDVYDPEDLDESAYSEMSQAARLAAELAIDRRRLDEDRLDMDDSEGTETSEELGKREDQLHKRFSRSRAAMRDKDEEIIEPVENLQDMRGHSLQEWVTQIAPRTEIFNRFRRFLTEFKDPDSKNAYVYRDRISRMCRQNLNSFEINYEHLAKDQPVLAFFLPECPVEILELFNAAATEVVVKMFPNYERINQEIIVRVAELPVQEDIRMLRQIHLNSLIRTNGVVVSNTGILPKLLAVLYNCENCGEQNGPIYITGSEETKPKVCVQCQTKGPFTVNAKETVYENFQRVIIQESPGKVAAGRLPRSKECILKGDLVDTVRPGDEIEVIGVYSNNYDGSLNTRNGFPVFATVIVVNHIKRNDEKTLALSLSDSDIKAIQALSKDEFITERIFNSMAPSIFGHDDIKRALALALFGGVPKNPGGKHKIRGDVNVLLCGDPGTAKSQFLKYVEKIANRPVFTTGQGASAVGLTAYVNKNPQTREWTLEAGALVLADKGVCLIDEFDKMNDSDRVSIHEAMEQQSISISKAGIVTSLQARCSVIAAANPIGGRYDASITFAENVNLSDPILSRFDVLCIVKDTVDAAEDAYLAKFVVESHCRSHPNNTGEEEMEEIERSTLRETHAEPIEQDLLKKYITYARERIHPKLHSVDQDKIANMYAELRRESMITGSVAITVRHIESIIRLSESHAKMHLREYVNEEDVNVAITVCLESFVSAQKFTVMKNMRRIFAKYLSQRRDNNELLLFLLRQLVNEHRTYKRLSGQDQDMAIKVPVRELEEKAKRVNILNLGSFFKSDVFATHGYKMEATTKMIAAP
ncbi:DNA replication licensing factor MCM2-like [Paramacrobiotus metropolitanus]|uniref:DNA replication licensing factor MCM2-like n=1 Tax=Paramacrobiotus metropolitanus TaxID=2943436 RepID=UPI0024456BB4|nr:DNA replication licensing factor MCM2-like [Paramacrobiotus metropolitanus]